MPMRLQSFKSALQNCNMSFISVGKALRQSTDLLAKYFDQQAGSPFQPLL